MFQCMGTNPAGSVQAAARLEVLTTGNFWENFLKLYAEEKKLIYQKMEKESRREYKKVEGREIL